MSFAEDGAVSPLPQVPQESGTAWIWPSRAATLAGLDSNTRRLTTSELRIAGRPVRDWIAEARRDLLQAARDYSPPLPGAKFMQTRLGGDPRLVLTGHQPELFHPGVWFKNFLASRVAAVADAVAIHLIADYDLCRSTLVRVPSIDPAFRSGVAVPLDLPTRHVPHELRTVQDLPTFAKFGNEVRNILRGITQEPLFEQIWPRVQDAAVRHGNLGQAISQGRHALEREWGLETLECPFSHVCVFPAFQAFVASILSQLSRFHEHHRQALRDYRKRYRTRSRTHPVPDLREDGAWLEAPFWAWTPDDPVRRALWARIAQDHWEIRAGNSADAADLQSPSTRLEVPNSGSQVAAIRQLVERGVCIRPRALTMTMFSRIFLGDLLIHGLGGAQYDRMTDQIIRRFYGVEPPAYAAATATFRLPIDRPQSEWKEVAEATRRLRELWYQPDRWLQAGPIDAATEKLLKNKRNLLQSCPPRGERRDWHRQLMEVNAELRTLTESLRADLHGQRETLRQSHLDDKFLFSREHPYGFFSARNLRDQLLDLAAYTA